MRLEWPEGVHTLTKWSLCRNPPPNANECEGEKRRRRDVLVDIPKVRQGGQGIYDLERMRGEDSYTQWKSLIPILYDWLANHNLVWPSLSCRWGPQVEQGAYKSRQRLYLSEQTDGSCPNTLVVLNCDVVKPRVAAAEHISQFNEVAKSPFVKKHKIIIHPGEVNRIRELPQNSNIVATHTDSPEVYIWNLESQPNRSPLLGASLSRPDLILAGHTENAEYALALSPTSPLVLSGGQDKNVVIWGIEDHVGSVIDSSSTRSAPASGGRQSWNSGGCGSLEKSSPMFSTTIGPRGIFEGHTATVEDVQFRPSSSQEFCSVGDDSSLILWDARTGTMPAIKVERAHDADLHCVDWNTHNESHLLTGSADALVRLFDLRKLSARGHSVPVETFQGHTGAVLCAQWCPDQASVFGSSAEDGILNIWDFEKVGKQEDMKGMHAPAGLFFRHAGHRDKVVDFHWNTCDPWTVVSVSDNCDSTRGGGTLQMWRMNDLIRSPEDEFLAEVGRCRTDVIGVSAATGA